MAGGKLRTQVALHLHRQADVLLDERHDRLVELACLVKLHRRDAQPFGVDLGRVRCVGASHAAADVGVVATGAGKREPFATVIERFENEDVRQVHAAIERVVHDEDVACGHVLTEVTHDRCERGRHGAQMSRQGQALRDQPSVRIGKACRVIHVVFQHARIGRAEDRQRHVVGHREQRVLEKLECNGIETLRHHRSSFFAPHAAPSSAHVTR